MIFCLVGTNPYDFSRLTKKLDQIALKISEPIVIQMGNTQHTPKNCEYFTFKSKGEVERLMKEAVLIVSQGGYGSMTDAIMMNKMLVAVPRFKEYGESQDNQAELVEYYESKGYLKACYEIDKLEEILIQTLANEFEFRKYECETDVKASGLIKEFLANL